jgi:DNA-binding transcriptional LysR family regulator
MHLTKQAVSKSLSLMETELGVQLFYRTHTGMVLTEAGECLKKYVEAEAELWSELLRSIDATEECTSIRVGAHLSHRTDADIRYMLDFHNTEPDCHVSIVDVEEHKKSWEMLRSRELDIVISRTHPVGNDLIWKKHMGYRVVLLVNENHRLAQNAFIDFHEDLKGERYFSMSKDTLNELSDLFLQYGIDSEYVTPNRGLIRELLRQNKGVFAVPDITASSFLREGVVAIPFSTFPITAGVYYVYRPDISALCKRFLKYMAGFAKE